MIRENKFTFDEKFREIKILMGTIATTTSVSDKLDDP